MSNKNVNQRILNSVGRQNYNEYMLLTNGKEIDSILNSNNSVFEMYKYKDKLLDKGVGQDITIDKLEELLKNNDDINLKESLEKVFLDYLTSNEFKTIKNILITHIGDWNINKLLNIHRKHKYHRIFGLLTINYKDWLAI